MHKIVLFTLLMTVLAVQPLAAQQTDPICGLLEESDCAIFQDSLAAMLDAGTFNNADFSLTIGGSGGTSTGNELTITGSGPMQLGDDGRITAMHISGTSDNGPLELLLLDDMMYVATQDSNGELVWSGASVQEDANAALLANMLSGNLFLNAFATPGVFTPTRIDDESMDDQTMIVFESDIDLVSFLLTRPMLNLLSDAVQNVPADAFGGEGGNLGTATEADLEGAVQLLPLLLDEDTVNVTMWVGADDKLIHHVELLIDVVLDATMIDPQMGAVGFNLEVASNLDGFGEEYDFISPEDYAPLDISAFDLIPVDTFNGGGGGPTETISDTERYAIEETIAYGETVSGTLSSDNPQDVWGFDAKAGDVVTIILKATDAESSLDTQIYLRDDQGAELAFNDDHDGSRSDLGIFDSLVADFEIPSDGQYRIVATWLTETRDGDYQLTLEVAD